MKTDEVFAFRDDPAAPYGFVAYPKHFIIKSVEAKMHLDTPYVRMVIDTKERYFNYLFDKERNYIPWEQREKEIKDLPTEIKTYDDGFRVERSREIITLEKNTFPIAMETITDMVYENEELLEYTPAIEFIPIDEVYEEFLERYRLTQIRKEKERIYLDPSTSCRRRPKMDTAPELMWTLRRSPSGHPAGADVDTGLL